MNTKLINIKIFSKPHVGQQTSHAATSEKFFFQFFFYEGHRIQEVKSWQLMKPIFISALIAEKDCCVRLMVHVSRNILSIKTFESSIHI